MAYIDRDLLIERIESKKISDFVSNWQKPEIKEAIYKQGQAIKEIIKKQPTADVVEVVRCKDCKYYKEATVGGIENLMLCHRLSPTKTFCMSNDFCNYGIRKEVD